MLDSTRDDAHHTTVARQTAARDVPVLSFFTGAGLLDIGFAQAGFTVVWHNECEPWFVDGFEYGMSRLIGDTAAARIQNTTSVLDVPPRRVLREAFGGVPPETFGVIGGPPCPDFSNGGMHRGCEGEHGILSDVFVHRVVALRPTFFVFENVAGLYRTLKHRKFLFELKARLEKHYVTSLQLLNALHFGVPQDRNRLFLIGLDRGWLRRQHGRPVASLPDTWYPWPHDSRYSDAERLCWPGPSPFGGSPPKPSGIPEELMVGPAICDADGMAALPNGTEGFRPLSGRFLTVAEGDVSRKSFKRLHRWRYSPAAAYGHNEVHLHPTEARRLTVREAMRIQTVPDAYALPGDMPLTHKFKTIANGVPVKLAEAVAGSMVSALRGDLNEHV